MDSWAVEEFANAALGDGRLNKRLIKLAERFADKPTASIPGACADWAETKAAYRFFDQACHVEQPLGWQDILSPHIEATVARMRQHPVVLCLQDSTELDFNGQEIEGLGPLCYEAQRGMYLHPTYAVTPEREPLGLTDAWFWSREPKVKGLKRPGIKESLRWIEGYERVAEMAVNLPGTRLVYVADREADIMALIQRADALGTPADWLIRSQHNRTLPKEAVKLWDTVRNGPVVGEIEFTLAKRRGQAPRVVRQQLFARRIRLSAGKDQQIVVTCVIAREINAPTGKKPLEWRLLSNRDANSLEAVVELIDWYRARWEIEIFFDVLKNGCRVEALQLAAQAKLELAISVYMVVAWRIARLMRLGRTQPDMNAGDLFTEEEWQGAYVLAKKPIPDRPPSLRVMIRQIAMLGGFLGRKGDGEPGVKTIWQGMQILRVFADGFAYAKSLFMRE